MKLKQGIRFTRGEKQMLSTEVLGMHLANHDLQVKLGFDRNPYPRMEGLSRYQDYHPTTKWTIPGENEFWRICVNQYLVCYRIEQNRPTRKNRQTNWILMKPKCD